MFKYRPSLCRHIKVYNEKKLTAAYPIAEWKCIKCQQTGKLPASSVLYLNSTFVEYKDQ